MLKRIRIQPLFVSLLTYDVGKERSAVILYSIAMATGIGLGLLMIERLVSGDFIPDPVLTGVFVIVISCIILIRRGHHKGAGSLILMTLSLFIQYQCYRFDGIHDSALMAFPGAFALAAILLGRILFYIYAGSSIASIVALGTLEITGVIRNGYSGKTTIDGIIDITVILAITAFVMKLLTDFLISNLDEARRNEKDRRLQAEQLVDSENRYRTLYEGANDGAFLLFEDTIVECNTMGLLLFAARDKRDIFGHRVWDFCPLLQPDGRNSKEKGYDILLDARIGSTQRLYWKFLRIDGRPFDAEISINRLILGGKQYIQACVRDITEQSLAAEENLLLAQTIKSVKDCISITDLNEQIVFVNDAFLHQYGYTEDELMGKHISSLRSPAVTEETVSTIYPATMGEGWHGELMNRRKDGTDFPVELWTSVVKDSTGVVRATVGVARDITERKRVERQLIQAQKLESIGTLSGGIAHDFNNLLAMVLGSAELLRLQIEQHPDLDKNVDRIISAAERGRSISRRLLNFSRPNPADLVPVSPSVLVNELREMLMCFFPKSITVETKIADSTSMIMGDPGQIHQALMNLALNSADAMDHAGCLTIEVCATDLESAGHLFAPEATGPFITISVADTGAGMDESMIGKIFDPFFSTKEQGKGTGLGLAIVQDIVKNHGGFIGVDSTLQIGTTFKLYFPIIHHEEHHAEKTVPHPARANTETILLVDDEQQLRELISDYLTASGFTVFTAANGMEALDLYRTYRESIDLVVTDLGMPEMDGTTLYHELRAINADVKVILASGFLDGITKNYLLEMGIMDVLTKPFNLIDLGTALGLAFATPGINAR
jgi:PAS domain S-box-containing protein